MSIERLILEELLDRKDIRFNIRNFLFKEQLDFVLDPAPFKTAVCSRRSGKTVACAADLIDTAINHASVICLYITLSRNNAKKIVWNEIIRINRIYQLNGHIDNTELSIKFPNQSTIYLSGAKDKGEIEKFRGLPLKKCYIDEVQSFRQYIRDLIDDVISPALMDYAGSLCLIGTPAPVPNGYFYECSNSDTWSHHAWTFWQNKFISDKSGLSHSEILERELKRRGVTRDDPSIQREFFGRWVLDTNSLVFRYSPDINHYLDLPILPKEWNHIIGVDVGLNDADAICVIAYNRNYPTAFLVYEDVETKQGVTELAHKLEAAVKKYKPDQIVMDTGGLGAKIAEELRRRYSLPIKAAEKVRKFEYIELLNDAMRTGRFMAKKESKFAEDCMLIEWDLDKTTPDKRKVSDRFHSDIADSVLYAFRESYHWISEPVPKAIEHQSVEWYQKEIEEMENAAQNSLHPEDDDPWAKALKPDSNWW